MTLELRGAGAEVTILDGKRMDRFFEVLGVRFHIKKVTIQNGAPPSLPGGGAILNRGGDLVVSNAKINNNSAAQGGGLSNFEGSMTVMHGQRYETIQ